MIVTPGDLFDRWSILRMKVRLSDDVIAEFEAHEEEVAQLMRPQLLGLVSDLVEANAKIWTLEASIRNGDNLPLEEVGRRALAIRDINRQRIEAKNTINNIFGFGIDPKMNHHSGG